MLWLLLSRFLLIALGGLIGVSTMCLMQINRQTDKEVKQIQRRNDE
ncbi:DUF3789 domain-containing protein [Vagococcus carniphilus]